jgi:hypothetical protein
MVTNENCSLQESCIVNIDVPYMLGTFTSEEPQGSFTTKEPSATFSSKKPSLTFTEV